MKLQFGKLTDVNAGQLAKASALIDVHNGKLTNDNNLQLWNAL